MRPHKSEAFLLSNKVEAVLRHATGNGLLGSLMVYRVILSAQIQSNAAKLNKWPSQCRDNNKIHSMNTTYELVEVRK